MVKGKAGKGQHSTSVRASRGGSAKAKGSTQGKPRPRKRSKVRNCFACREGSNNRVWLLQLIMLQQFHDVVSAHAHYLTLCVYSNCDLQVVQYVDDDDIDGLGEMYDDDADDDFKAPGTSAAARKRLEPML